MKPAHRFRLAAPRISDHEVEFEWEVVPDTELYARDGFRLSFPRELDLTRVPEALWLRIAMICLHPHWALLAPCRVELPFYIGSAEREFWRRLTETVCVQLHAYGGGERPPDAIEIRDDGPALEPVAIETSETRAAAAFSGGKDSLTQAGLLSELTDTPLLVATTSPVPWANDHLGAARARALSEIALRMPVELVEIGSDFRSVWDNGFSERDGCTLTVNELTDVLLYQATTVAAAAASGIGRSFMASEAELQYNKSVRGQVILHGHSAASAVTHSALDTVLGRFGLGLSSLTYPLPTDWVQSLLVHRYSELAELQFSCWSAADGQQACSDCHQCNEIAVMLIGEGLSPRRAGIDPGRVFRAWVLVPPDPTGQLRPRLHPERRPRDKQVRIVQRTPVEQVAEILAGDPELDQAIDGYKWLYEQIITEPAPPPHPGYIVGFLDRVPDDLRGPLRKIFDEQGFVPSDDPELALMCQRSRSLARWIADPIA